MRDYGKVRTVFWTDDRVASLSDDGKLLALYLLTSPHANAVGCYRLPSGYVSDDVGWERARVERAFGELVEARFARRCPRTGWTLIVNYLRHNEIENGNVGKACVRMLEQVPASVPFADALLRALSPCRERFPDGFLERYAKRFPNPLPIPEPEPNPEPSTKADAFAAASREAPAAPTDAELVWGDGLAWLSQASGKAASGLRALIGRWCAVYGADHVLVVMSDCRSQSPPVVGPVAWIEAALKHRKTAHDRHRSSAQPPRRRNGLLELREQELGLSPGKPGGGVAGWDGTAFDLDAAAVRVA